MTNFPIRFGRGQGLELSSGEKLQRGLTRLDNAIIDQRDVVGRRTGAILVSRTVATNPVSTVPATDCVALAYRNSELLLQTTGELLSRRECGGDAMEDLGTATPEEVSATIAEIELQAQSAYTIPIAVSGDAGAIADAYTRVDRSAFDPIVLSTGIPSVTVTFSFDGPTPRLTWTGTDNGSQDFDDGLTMPRHVKQVPSTNISLLGLVNPGVNERSTLIVHKVVFDGVTVVITPISVTTNIVGNPQFFALYDIDERNAYAITEPVLGTGDFQLERVVDVPEAWPLQPADNVRISVGGSFLFTARTEDVVDAVRASYTPLLGPSKTSDEIQVFRFIPAMPSEVSQTVPTNTVDVSSQLGISEDAANDVIGLRPAGGISYYAMQRTATATFLVVDVQDAPAAAYELRYTIDGSSLRVQRLIDSAAQDDDTTYASDGLTARTLRAAFDGDGRHLVGALSALGDLQVLRYGVLGALDPEVHDTHGGVGAVGLHVDATIAGYVRLENDVVLGSIHRVAWTQSADLSGPWGLDEQVVLTVVDQDPLLGSGASLSLSPLPLDEATVRATQYGADPDSPDSYRLVYSYQLDTSTSQLEFQATEPVGSVVGVSVTGHLQLGAPPRILWGFEDQNQSEVYEQDLDLWVRVLPATIALSAGDWSVRGPWTQARLRQVVVSDWGLEPVQQTTAVAVTSPSTGIACVLVLSELGSGGSLNVGASIYSTHTESGGPGAPLVIEALAVAPHTSHCRDDLAAACYVSNSTDLRYFFWTPGDSFSPIDTGVDAHSGVAPVLDMSGGALLDGTGYTVMVVRDSAQNTRILVYDEANTLLANFTDVLPFGLDATCVACYALSTYANPLFVIAQAAADGNGLQLKATLYELLLGVPTVIWTHSWQSGKAGDTAVAITTGALTGRTAPTNALVSVELLDGTTGERETRTYDVASGSDTLVRRQPLAAVFGAYYEMYEQLVFGESDISTFAVGSIPTRNGIFHVAPLTNEQVARIEPSAVEDLVVRASQRNQVADANLYNTLSVYMGYAATTGAVPQLTTSERFAMLDFIRRPHHPALLNGVVVGALAGYPRMYDGSNVNEQDYHQLPQILSTGDSAGAIPAGSYGVAVTYELFDVQGQLYRSAPAFDRVTLAGPGNIDIVCRPLSRTERVAVTIRAWRTDTNGAIYYASSSTEAITTGNTVSFNLTADAALLSREQLDQVAGGTLPSERTSITDWLALADGRFWSRNPQRGNLARFTTPAREGFAPHWPLQQGLELTTAAEITGLATSDGRIILFSALEGSWISTGGPDATGAGSYGTVNLIPSNTGATAHPTIALTPDGHIYGGEVPYIMTRGMSTQEYADAVYAPYERDGEALNTSIWRADRREAVLSNGPQGRTLRFHPGSLRWCEDTTRPARDQATSITREVSTLCDDGRILVERPDDAPVYDDGGSVYRFVVSTPWIHTPRQDMQPHTANTYRGSAVTGHYRGPHELQLRVYLNYSDVPIYTMRVDAAQIEDNHANGVPYLYEHRPVQGVNCYAFRVEVSDNAETNDTFALEAIDCEFIVAGSSQRRLTPAQSFRT